MRQLGDGLEMRPKLNYRRPALFGIFVLVVLLGGGFAWASIAEISGAVIASGTVIVEGKPKSVQHLDGGIVKSLHVNAGDQVTKDQLLVMLDDTSIAANLAIYERRLVEGIVRQERLGAELRGQNKFAPPTKLAILLKLGDLTGSMEQQMSLLQARMMTRESQLGQFDQKIEQFGNQITGVKALKKEKKIQIDTYTEELTPLIPLMQRGLVAKKRVMALERAKAELRGQIAEHGSEVSRLQNSISETRIAKLQVNREFRERVVTEVEKNDARIDELRQQMEATRKQLARVAIRAPVAGIVHELNLFTVGGVVQPGQTVMQIIPQNGEHEVELNLDTLSIDQVFIGQRAIVRFPSFHQRTTPELEGVIGSVSPSSVVDEKSGASFYRVSVIIDETEMKELKGKKLIPGMPVEAFFPTSSRTVMSYLIKPLTDHFMHVFRER